MKQLVIRVLDKNGKPIYLADIISPEQFNKVMSDYCYQEQCAAKGSKALKPYDYFMAEIGK